MSGCACLVTVDISLSHELKNRLSISLECNEASVETIRWGFFRLVMTIERMRKSNNHLQTASPCVAALR